MKVYYQWFDYYGKCYRQTECEVLADNGKTATIELKGFGKNNTPPQTIIRCQLKSLIGYTKKEINEKWKSYNYFD